MTSGVPDVSKAKSFDSRLIFAPLALAVIVLGGFFGYRLHWNKQETSSLVPNHPIARVCLGSGDSILVAIWLVINSIVTSPVESLIGLALIALGLPVSFSLSVDELQRDLKARMKVASC